jgi:hypothetical protein
MKSPIQNVLTAPHTRFHFLRGGNSEVKRLSKTGSGWKGRFNLSGFFSDSTNVEWKLSKIISNKRELFDAETENENKKQTENNVLKYWLFKQESIQNLYVETSWKNFYFGNEEVGRMYKFSFLM